MMKTVPSDFRIYKQWMRSISSGEKVREFILKPKSPIFLFLFLESAYVLNSAPQHGNKFGATFKITYIYSTFLLINASVKALLKMGQNFKCDEHSAAPMGAKGEKQQSKVDKEDWCRFRSPGSSCWGS